jgi:hypothetical protein
MGDQRKVRTRHFDVGSRLKRLPTEFDLENKKKGGESSIHRPLLILRLLGFSTGSNQA